MIKKIKLGLGALLAEAVISGCSIDRLYVNRYNDSHYCMQRSQKDGENDISRLRKVFDVEEAWVFVSGNDKEGKKLEKWCEIGEKETNASANFNTGTVLKIVRENNANYAALYHYHTINREFPWGSEVPSQKDLISYLDTAKYVYDNYPNVGIESRVVVGLGIYNLRLNRDSLNSSIINLLGLLATADDNLHSGTLELIRDWGEDDNTELLKRFARNVSDQFLNVTFEPNKK